MNNTSNTNKYSVIVFPFKLFLVAGLLLQVQLQVRDPGLLLTDEIGHTIVYMCVYVYIYIYVYACIVICICHYIYQ